MTTNILTTERLFLRSVTESDFEPLFQMAFSDPDVMQHAFEAKVLSREEAMAFFLKDFDLEASGKKAGVIIEKSTGATIGFGGLIASSVFGEEDYEIGFVFAKDSWGKGYATEVGKAQIAYGLDTLGYERMLAFVAPKNLASVAVLKKIGMSHFKTIETQTRGPREVYAAFATNLLRADA